MVSLANEPNETLLGRPACQRLGLELGLGLGLGLALGLGLGLGLWLGLGLGLGLRLGLGLGLGLGARPAGLRASGVRDRRAGHLVPLVRVGRLPQRPGARVAVEDGQRVPRVRIS